MSLKPLPEMDAIPVFEKIQHELLTLLKSLSSDEWRSGTPGSEWDVKDIAAHLLDGDLRRLSMHRDLHELPGPSEPIQSQEALVDFLNELNGTWIRASKRLSPALIIELTEFTTPRVIEHFKQLDPKGTAIFSVGWAGETESENRFDIAREYTEKWHHQQQIREAVGRPLLTGKTWLSPLIHTLIRGVPPVFNKYAPKDESEPITIHLSGVLNDSWILANRSGRWQLFKPVDEHTGTTVDMSDDTAWRLFTGRISEEEALKRIRITGNRDPGKLIAKTVSFMK